MNHDLIWRCNDPIWRVLDTRRGAIVATVTAVICWFLVFEWGLALLIIAAISIHEIGHVLAMRHYGIPSNGFFLIPLLGGVASHSTDFKMSARESFVVSIAGPVVGAAPCLILLPFAWMTDAPKLYEACAWIAMVNFINLLPLWPLDGGRILLSIGYSWRNDLCGCLVVGLAGFAVTCALYLMDSKWWMLAIVATAFGCLGAGAEDPTSRGRHGLAAGWSPVAFYAGISGLLALLWLAIGADTDKLFLI